ncbi:hypothetical protein Tco_0073174 [Tanacetum coccineum]
MADENVPSQALTRSDDHILPFSAWVPIGKRNYVLDLQKKQKNPIFQISMDILQNINFFRAFTASALVPAIYIQQFWNTLAYEAKTGVYSFELDESLFVLDANLLKEALEITPIDQAHQFVSPPSGDAIIDFVNELEFVQAIQTFLTDKANLDSPTKRSASPFHLVEEDLRLGNLKFVSKGEADEVFGMPIPNELISNNIRNAPYYNMYLEMVAKHDQKVAAEKEGKKKTASTKQPKPKPAKEKPSKPSTAKLPKPKPAKEKSTKATPLQKAGKAQPEPEPKPEHQGKGEEYDMERAIQMSLESFQAQSQAHGKAIVTDEQAAQSLLALHTLKRRSTTDQFILQRRTPTTEEASTGPSTQPLDDTSANIVRDSPSHVDAETGARSDKTSSGGDTEVLQITEELGEDVEKQEKVEEKTVELDEEQAGSDPGETHES